MNIFDIPLLSTAISIVIAWALFSMLCSLVHELISQLKGERGRFMKQYMFAQLRDIPNGLNWGSLIYLQGNIDLLSRAPEKPSSELPPEELAKALISSVENLHVPGDADQITTNSLFNVETFAARLDLLKPSDVVRFMKQAASDAVLKCSVDEPTKRSGLTYAALVENLTKWFETFDKRLSLWYKKKTKERLFILGLLVAFFINVDSVQLFKYFNLNPEARKDVQQFYKNEVQKKQQSMLDSIEMGKINRDMSTSYIKALDSVSNAHNMQFGYEYNILSKNFSRTAKPTDYMIKFLGIVISAFAASMGAPFWFELLKNVYKKS